MCSAYPVRSILPLVLGLSLVRCMGPVPVGSNLSSSNDEAQKSLQVRLQATETMRAQFRSIRDALRPLEALLRDVSISLNSVQVSGSAPDEELTNVIALLRRILKELTLDLVQHRPDGSWELERQLELPGSGDAQSRRTIIIRVQGRRVDNRDELLLKVRNPGASESKVLASVQVTGPELLMHFHPEALESVILPDLRSGACTITVQRKHVEVHCDPFEVRNDRFFAFVNQLEFSQSPGSTTAFLSTLIRRSDGVFVAGLEVEARPGMKTRIELRTEE